MTLNLMQKQIEKQKQIELICQLWITRRLGLHRKQELLHSSVDMLK